MGVPAFYTWLIEKYPNIAMKMSTNNKFICDYFYLDMNGIIHPCCHPEGKLKPLNEEQMIEFMCRYLDMLLKYVEPKQLLFIAIDGPPPRAKMMQQRERRFIHEYEAKINQSQQEWDSNQITPGTSFMTKVKHGLNKYIINKLSNDAHYRHLKIILSDSSVPGEGEHKILDFIRNLRYRGDYKESASHLLFSNDADMIFLSLLLHERNVYLMRDIPLRRAIKAKKTLFETKYNIIDFKQLRAYLTIDLSKDKMKYTHFSYDIDRVMDDFVFLSYFVGNDFIPSLPFMNMRDGAFEYILHKYIESAPHLPKYLTNGIHINFDALNIFLSVLAKEERDIFIFRTHCLMERIDPNSSYKRSTKRRKNESNKDKISCKKRKLNDGTSMEINKLSIDELNKNVKEDLQFISFGKEGYKKRYYQRKFDDEYGNELVNKVVMEYIRALSWIQHYYFSGIVSWKWCYPYHYAPLITDITATDLSKYSTDALWSTYDVGEPLRPLVQLALVMPKTSANITLPPVYYDAIFGEDSTLLAYYPESFTLDLNFKELNWESIARIKHVNVEELEQVLESVKHELSDEYKKQNIFGNNKLYLHSSQKHTKDVLNKEWGLNVVNDNDDDGKSVYCFDIKILNALNVSFKCRKCEINENNLKEINENDLNIVSQTMCKFFMSGKQRPRGGIVKYMKKRPNLWTKSVSSLRNGIKRSRKSTKTFQKRMILQKQKEQRKMEKKKKERNNNDFIAKLKSIGLKQKMNGTNASKLIIDSVLSAINTSKDIWNNNDKEMNIKKQNKGNHNEIKMNVKSSNKFKKKRKRKRKREKLKKMISGADLKSVSMNIHPLVNNDGANRIIGLNHRNINHRNIDKEKLKHGQSTERNAQVCEVESLVHHKAIKKKKRNKKKQRKKLSQH